MWLGEQISSRGVGNGISLIITAGIIANLPSAFVSTSSTRQNRRIKHCFYSWDFNTNINVNNFYCFY